MDNLLGLQTYLLSSLDRGIFQSMRKYLKLGLWHYSHVYWGQGLSQLVGNSRQTGSELYVTTTSVQFVLFETGFSPTGSFIMRAKIGHALQPGQLFRNDIYN